MGSISTTRGDSGQTGLAGGIRVSKASLRVEAYGSTDELNSALGFARSICEDAEMRDLVKRIQQELFRIGSSLATPPASPKAQVPITTEMVDALTADVHRFESVEGVLKDWSIPGELTVASAFDLARTICRRTERCVVRLVESGDEIQTPILPYLNRLSDLLWIAGRKLEHDAGVNGSLRETTGKAGNRFSRAW